MVRPARRIKLPRQRDHALARAHALQTAPRMIRFLSFLILAGCASGIGQPDDVVQPDGGVAKGDSPAPQPPSSSECEPDHHACGVVCLPRQPNDPANGCALGCATACTAPANATATCSAQGTCDFA